MQTSLPLFSSISLVGDNGQLFGWPASTWLWIDQSSTMIGIVMMVMSLVGAIWAWIQRDSIHNWFRVNRFPIVGEAIVDNQRWNALIFTVSKVQVPKWVIEQKRPDMIALLATKESREDAEKLINHARQLGIKTIASELIDNPDDPSEARDKTTCLIRLLQGMEYNRIAVDITGGKTPMSLGAFMAAEEQQCDTLYVSSTFDQKLKKPDMRSARILCISRAT